MTSYPAGGYSPSGWQFSAAPPTAVPATIAKSASYTSGIIACQGYNAIAVSANIDQAGSLSLQRYIDAAGTIPIGTPITQALTSTVLGTVFANDGQPWSSFQVTVTNSSGSTAANLTQFEILISQVRT